MDNKTEITDDTGFCSNQYDHIMRPSDSLQNIFWCFKEALNKNGQCWCAISKMAVIFRAIHCAHDGFKVYFLKDILHSVIQENIPSEEILDLWNKHCFSRAIITHGLGSFNEQEWAKNLVYSVPKLGKKIPTLLLYNSKGSL